MIHLTGDVYLDRDCRIDMEINTPIINLEFPLSRRGTPARHKVNLGQDQSFFEGTFSSKLPLAVNLANNHIMDYGESAFNDTLLILNDAGVKYFGAGREKDNYRNPLFFKLRDKTICLSGYCCQSTHPVCGNSFRSGAAPLIKERVFREIINCRDHCDFLVISFHWGEEQLSYPKPEDVDIAHRCIDLGADLIIGHHAHVIQSMEIYNGKHIFYGLGNFIFPDTEAPSNYDGKTFKKKITVHQRPENLKSIVVCLQQDLAISYKLAFFSQDTVRFLDSPKSIPRWIPRSKAQFDRLKKWNRKLNMLRHFIESPRIPSSYQVNRLLFG